MTRHEIALQLVCINFEVALFPDNFREFATLNAAHEDIFKLPIFIESRQEYFCCEATRLRSRLLN